MQKQKIDEKIESLALEMSDIKQTIENLEQTLINNKEEFNKRIKELADLMEAEGFSVGSKISLKNGRTLLVKEYFTAAIPSQSKIAKEKDPFIQKDLIEKKEECFEWLDENGLGDIVKNKLTAQFGKGEKEKVMEALKYLQSKEVECMNEETVHSSTLRAALKEVIKAGMEVPFDLFGINHGITVDLK